MNTNSMNKRPQIYSAKKPCCKVCVDAGKSENEYSSHYVKDLNGKVTCPTLLNQECRFCNKKGHTISHCSELAKKKEKESSQYEKPPLSPPKKEVKKSNVFAYLEMNSDDSEEEDEQEEFPSLATNIAVQPSNYSYGSSYATIAAKTISDYNKNQKKELMTKIKDKSKKTWPALAPGQKKTWVQVCDEDSSDEEKTEEECYEDNSAW